MTESPSTGRLDALDVARGLGILLVVVGHTLRGLTSSELVPAQGTAADIDAWMYAFHMPLFFALSGYFLPNALSQPFGSFVRSRLLRLGYPYLIWATLQALVQVAASRFTNHRTELSDIWHIVYEPPMQFWFLYVLFIDSVLIAALWSLGLRQRGLLWVGALLLMAGPYMHLPFTWIPLYQARDNFFYIVLGASGLFAAALALPRWPRVAITGLGFVFVTAIVMLRESMHWPQSMTVLTSVAGSFATLCLASLIHTGAPSKLLRYIGQHSMEIFVAHTIASAGIRIVLLKLLHVESASVHVVLGLLGGVLGPLLLVELCERARFPYLFAWPKSRAKLTQPAA